MSKPKVTDPLESIATGSEIDFSVPDTIFTMPLQTEMDVRFVRLEDRGFFPRKSANPAYALHYTSPTIEDGFLPLSLGNDGREDYNAVRGSGEVSRRHSSDPKTDEYNWSFGERKSNQLWLAKHLLRNLIGGDIADAELTPEKIQEYHDADWKTAPYTFLKGAIIVSWSHQLSRLVGLSCTLRKINQYEYTDGLGAVRESPEFVPVF